MKKKTCFIYNKLFFVLVHLKINTGPANIFKIQLKSLGALNRQTAAVRTNTGSDRIGLNYRIGPYFDYYLDFFCDFFLSSCYF